jgi:hypothetical protein
MTLKSGPNLGVLVDGALGEAHYTELMRQWRALDALIQIHVKSRSVTAQPGSPADGDAYIIPSSATGAAWSGKTNQIARFSTTTAGWEFFVPKKGWQVRVEDENNSGRPKLYVFDGAAWQDDTAAGGMTNPMSAKGDLIAGGASGAPVRVPAGTTGQVPTMQADGSVAYQDPAAGMANPMTAKGDMIAGGTGGAPTRIPKGTTGQVPTMQADGTVAFQTPGGIPPGYIDGLKMVRVSGTALTVTTGNAYVPSANGAIGVTANIAKTGLSLTANTWYHVYLYMNGANADVEIVTTAPAAPYSGTARNKTGDNTRRYIGSILTDASGNIIPFDHCTSLNSVMYAMSINNAPLHPLTAGNTVTPSSSNIDLSTSIPVTGRRATLYLENGSGNGSVAYIANPDLGDPVANVISFVRAAAQQASTYLLSSDQKINYTFNVAPSSGKGLDVWVLGYYYER